MKSGNISFESIDMARAKFDRKALEIENEEERVAAINETIENPDLSGSRFVDELESHLLEIIETQTPKIEGTEMEDVDIDRAVVE